MAKKKQNNPKDTDTNLACSCTCEIALANYVKLGKCWQSITEVACGCSQYISNGQINDACIMAIDACANCNSHPPISPPRACLANMLDDQTSPCYNGMGCWWKYV